MSPLPDITMPDEFAPPPALYRLDELRPALDAPQYQAWIDHLFGGPLRDPMRVRLELDGIRDVRVGPDGCIIASGVTRNAYGNRRRRRNGGRPRQY
jgi:hypothetical protein